MSETLNYVGDGFEIKDGSLVIFNAEEYFGIDEFCDNNQGFCDVVIPDGVVSIGKGAFAGCSCIRSVVIPGDVASIEAEAFKNCRNLSSICFSNEKKGCDGVKIIGREVFAGCVSLIELNIPNSVIFIGDGAFAGLKNLELLTTPENLELSDSVWQPCSLKKLSND